MATNQACESEPAPVDEESVGLEACGETDSSDGHSSSSASTSSLLSDLDIATSHRATYSPFLEERQHSESSYEFKSKTEFLTEFSSYSHDSVSFKSPSLSATEFKSQSQSSNEFKSPSQSSIEFESQGSSQCSIEFISKSHSPNDFRSQSEFRSQSFCSFGLRSESQSPTEFRSLETQSFILAEWRSGHDKSVQPLGMEESSEYHNNTSTEDVTENTPLLPAIPSRDCRSHCSQQADIQLSGCKTLTLGWCNEPTCNITEDVRFDSSYFGDNEAGDREWSDLKSASSCSDDLTISCGTETREPSASDEKEIGHRLLSASHTVFQTVSPPAQKIDGCGDVPVSTVCNELRKELEDPIQSMNSEMKLHPTCGIGVSTVTVLQSRVEDPGSDSSLESLDTKEDVTSLGIADVNSQTYRKLFDRNWAIKAERTSNDTIQGNGKDWLLWDDKDSVSTIYCDPEYCSSEEDLLKHCAVASIDDLTDLDSLVPSDNASATELSERYLDGSSCIDLEGEHVPQWRAPGKNVKRPWSDMDMSPVSTIITSNPTAEGQYWGPQQEKTLRVLVGHSNVDEESNICELKNVRLTNGEVLLNISKQSLADEGFVSQQSAISCNTDLSSPPQHEIVIPHHGKVYTELPKTTSLLPSVVELTGMEEPNKKPGFGFAADESRWHVQKQAIVCNSLQPTKPLDLNIIARQLASSSIASAVSDLTSEWSLKMDINNEELRESLESKDNMIFAEEDKLVKEASSHFESLIDRFKSKLLGNAGKVSEVAVSADSSKMNNNSADQLGNQSSVLFDHCPLFDSSATFHWQAQSVSVYRVLPAVDNGIRDKETRCPPERQVFTPLTLLQDTDNKRCSLEREVYTRTQSSSLVQSGDHYRRPIEDERFSNEAVGCPSQDLPQHRLLTLKTQHHLELFEIKSGRFSTYERLVPALGKLGDLHVVVKRDKPDAADQGQTTRQPATGNTRKKALKKAKRKRSKVCGGSRKNTPSYGIYIFRPSQQYPDVTEGNKCQNSQLSNLVTSEIAPTKSRMNVRCKSNGQAEKPVNNDTNSMSNVVASFTKELVTQALSGFVRNVKSCPLESVPVVDSRTLSSYSLDEQSRLKQQVLDNAKLHLEDEMAKNIKGMSRNGSDGVSSATDLSQECAVLADIVINKAKAKVERELLSKDSAEKEEMSVQIPADPDREVTRNCQKEHSASPGSSPLYLLNGSTDSSLGSLLARADLDTISELISTPTDSRTSSSKFRFNGLSSSIFNMQPICSPFPQQTTVYDSRWWIQRPYPQTQIPRCPLFQGPEADSRRYRLLIEPQDYLPLDRKVFDVPVCLEDTAMQTNQDCLGEFNTSTAQTRYARQYYSRKIQCSLCKGHKQM